MKAVIGGILGGSIVVGLVFGLILIMPTEIQEVQNIIKEESMNPCQKAVIGTFQLAKKNAHFASSSYTQEDLKKWQIEYEATEKRIKHIIENGNCIDKEASKGGAFVPIGDWYTPEFQQKMQMVLDAGF